jgi:hypothetical protein
VSAPGQGAALSMRGTNSLQRTQQQPKGTGDPYAHLPPKVGTCCSTGACAVWWNMPNAASCRVGSNHWSRSGVSGDSPHCRCR